MKTSIKQHRANKKAWQYFRELVNDDEKYFSFKNKGTPLEIDGSDGGKYYLYPSGKFARISDDEPRLGSVNFGRDMPEADYFSTLFVWITKNEKVFKEKFGCGSISSGYRQEQREEHILPANFNAMIEYRAREIARLQDALAEQQIILRRVAEQVGGEIENGEN